MTLLSYLLRRLVGFAAVMIGISIITFALSHVVPADPAIVALGDHATDAQIEAFREKYGLNKPVPEQYWIYVTNLLQGDLGISLRTRRPVAEDLRNFFPATFELSLTALVLSILIGIPQEWSAGLQICPTMRAHRLLIGGSVPFSGGLDHRFLWPSGLAGACIDKFSRPAMVKLFTGQPAGDIGILSQHTFVLAAGGLFLHRDYRSHDALEHARGAQPPIRAVGASQGLPPGKGGMAPRGSQRADPHGDDDRGDLWQLAFRCRVDRDHF
jgi:hypothetical protein